MRQPQAALSFTARVFEQGFEPVGRQVFGPQVGPGFEKRGGLVEPVGSTVLRGEYGGGGRAHGFVAITGEAQERLLG